MRGITNPWHRRACPHIGRISDEFEEVMHDHVGCWVGFGHMVYALKERRGNDLFND